MGLDENPEGIEAGRRTQAADLDEESAIESAIEEKIESAGEEEIEAGAFLEEEPYGSNRAGSGLQGADEARFSEEGPDGAVEAGSEALDGELAALVQKAGGLDLSEGGFYVVDAEGRPVEPSEVLDEQGRIDGYDADAFEEGGDLAEGIASELAEEEALEELEGGVEDEPQDGCDQACADGPGHGKGAEEGLPGAPAEGLSPTEGDGEEEEEEEEEDFELVEIELDEEEILRYIEDEEGARIGFVLLEDGEETEYYYVSDEDSGSDGEDVGLGITKEGVADAARDMNAIYRDGVAVAGELKAALDDIKSAFNLSSFLK